jgi:hypothetical protein
MNSIPKYSELFTGTKITIIYVFLVQVLAHALFSSSITNYMIDRLVLLLRITSFNDAMMELFIQLTQLKFLLFLKKTEVLPILHAIGIHLPLS